MTIDRELSQTLTYKQRYILALVRTASGSLSLFCSSIILYKIYLRYQEHRAANGSLRSGPRQAFNTYYRMLMSVSVMDIMYSFWAALSVLPVPKDFGGVFARGTVATCSAQAFFNNANSGILLYMATLNTYFMLKIRYNIPDAVITRRYEIWFHAVPIGVWLTTGILGLSLKVFGPILLPELGCWIGSYPYGCLLTNTCTRGFRIVEYNDWYAWLFCLMWLFICVIVVVVNSILIYTAIRKQERRNERYLAAKLQTQGQASSRKLQTTPNSGSQQISVPELPLPDFDFVEQDCGGNRDASLFVADVLLSSHMVLDSPDNQRSNPAVNENHSKVSSTMYKNDPPVVLPSVNEVKVEEDVDKTGHSPTSNEKNNTSSTNQRRIKQSRMAAVQSSFYIVSALLTTVWIFFPWLGYKLQVKARVRFFFAYMANTVAPAQGILNLLIFVRLQYLHLRETKKDWGRFRCFKHCLFSAA